MPANDAAWHTIRYHISRYSAVPRRRHYAIKPDLSLLDEVGRPAVAITRTQFAVLKAAANTRRATPLALLHYGEALFGAEEHPEAALPYFKRAFAGAAGTSPVRGLAAWDGALARYRFGAYEASAEAFARLQHSGFAGLSHRSVSLMERYAAACAGYHTEHSDHGIPEPPKLDPFCGASALAVWLKARHKECDKAYLAKICRVTGEGSTLADVLHAAERIGVHARAVTADDRGLCELPKPALAYVEHDHFIAVTQADKSGVDYICSDCGPWPGGVVHLTWKQWRMVDPGLYAVFTTPGSGADKEIASVGRQGVQLASSVLEAGIVPHVNIFGVHVKLYVAPAGSLGCGGKLEGQKCPAYKCCPKYTPSPSKHGPVQADPVNLATGEEEYGPLTDLKVYNPIGPSVTWSRIYDSLRAPRSNGTYEYIDYGVGWSQSYNISVLVQSVPLPPPGGGGTGSFAPNTSVGTSTNIYIVYPNGSRIQLTPTSSTPPSAAHPSIPCTVTAGADVLAAWNYNTATGTDYFLVTLPNRSKWILTPVDPTDYTQSSGTGWYSLTGISDDVGNSISLQYSNAYGGLPVITGFYDSRGAALLTVQRDAVGDITSITDRYNRSVYYNVGTYNTVNVSGLPSYQELDHVSQIVTTGTPSPADRYVYGYSDVLNGEGNEEVPFLTGITVPSPTGTGTSTASISYIPYTDYVNTITDANGNVTTFTQVDANHTKVSIANSQGIVAYSYTAGFDNNMSATTSTDGTNQNLLIACTYGDPNDPYAPSVVEDANGEASGGAKGTWYYSYDQYGHTINKTNPYGTVTSYSYSYANFALGELAQYQEGGKTPTSFTYYEPSGLLKSESTPLPGTAGSGQTVTTNYTYTALGNLLTVTSPGNNTSPTLTATYGYTQDGNYSQPEALDEALTVTDNLNHTIHTRYDARDNTIASIDAAGIETDYTYDVADKPIATIYPATGETGTGRSEETTTYLYPGGPVMAVNEYDESGNMQRQVLYTYGKEGEELGESGSTEPFTHGYDAYYRTISITDGNGHTTAYAYNAAGHLASMTYPDGKQFQCVSYDPDGNLLKVVDARGIETDYTYNDPDNKLTEVSYPTSPALDESLSYDSYGRLVSLTDSTGTQSKSYDDRNALLSSTTTYTGLPAATISYSYNPDGTRDTMDTPAGAFNYNYDGAERQTSVTNPYNETFSWTYSVNNWLLTQNSDGVFNTTYTLDPLCRVTGLSNNLVSNNNLLSSFSHGSYDAVGNLNGDTSNVPSAPIYSGETTYQYDARDQLKQEQSTSDGGYTNSFSYDTAGNAVSFKGELNAFNGNNQNTANIYDPNGNPTTYHGVGCSWDADNQMTSYGTAMSAGYTAIGLRAWKQTAAGKTYYLYDGDFPVCELDSAGNVAAVNTCGTLGLTSRHTSAGSVLYTFDLTGDVAQRINSAGQVVSSDDFNAFGSRTSNDNNTDPFGYRGQEGYYTDTETGLVYLDHRYYDPQSGTFLNRDPIGFGGGVNIYSYVENNPVNGLDCSGLAYKGGGHEPDYSHPCGDIPSCKSTDNCDVIALKMFCLRLLVFRHLFNSDGTGRGLDGSHDQDIGDRMRQLENCARVWDRMECPGEKPPTDKPETCHDPLANYGPDYRPAVPWLPVIDPGEVGTGLAMVGVGVIAVGVVVLCPECYVLAPVFAF